MNIERDLFLTQQILSTLFSVTNKLQLQGNKYLQDLTLRQMLAIPAIIHAPGEKATINHIARSLGTSKQSAKQIVDVMEKKKYLIVTQSKNDKRAVNITITPEGKQAFAFCSNRTDEFLADIFHDFATRDLETLWTLIKKLYQFDGVPQDGLGQHPDYSASRPDEILKHHQGFAKKRLNKAVSKCTDRAKNG